MDFRHMHSATWIRHFVEAGYPDARPLAAGVEGAVYRLDDAVVAKVWGRRREADLLLWKRFYADLAASGLPFGTPVILAVEEVDGTAVTIEQHLAGTPLQERIDGNASTVPVAVVDSIVGVLRALSTVPATEAMRRLPVLDESHPLRRDGDDFPTALGDLLHRRTRRFGGVLRMHIPDFEDRYAEVIDRLSVLGVRADTVLHGDLVAGNVLVDVAGRPSAVLDFGFLSGAGDPRFDAAVTAAVMNMYGPHAADITESLTEHFAAELGYSCAILRLYRAAYAIATSNAFTADGSDGHFQWCVRQILSTTGCAG